MRKWKKHPKKEGEDALRKLAAMGWRIEDPPKYYTAYCPCGEHMTHVHISPSNPLHYRQRLRWAERQSCMKEGQ